ncbi:hypothetical protein BN1058_00216 [Paraliobacillus sp. PM-2]|uniref:hypothetical protein n=1 Tax=Paraliobacillus sp. PM-2 TaxID=1462524 RepID=UPI00061C07C8|nr:hypothetical protein [Paraliobacillus sp. PM-2]CQR45973.1 hypothetical protein BN1058_00216 [Paraliobacillus sp. PM-2]
MAPKGDTCRLVATVKEEEDIQLTVLHQDKGFLYFPLSKTNEQSKDIKEYISSIQSKIESGIYQIELVDMNKEATYC